MQERKIDCGVFQLAILNMQLQINSVNDTYVHRTHTQVSYKMCAWCESPMFLPCSLEM